MGVIARLQHAGNKFNLNDGTTFRLGTGYSPPQTTTTGDGEGIFTHVVPLIVHGDTGMGIQHSIDAINAFITTALNSDAHPLFFEFKGFDGHDYDPLWGQVGGVRRIRVISGYAQPGSGYHVGFIAGAMPQVVLQLTCKNVAEGLPQQVASAHGSVQDVFYGLSDTLCHGQALFGGSATNLFTDPNSKLTGFTVGAGLNGVLQGNKEFVFGNTLTSTKSYNLVYTGATNILYENLALTGATTYCIQFMAKRRDGGTVSASDVAVFYSATAETSTYTEIGNGWWLVWATVTGTGASAATGCVVTSGAEVFVDSFVCWQGGYPLWPFSGDSNDSQWSGTQWDSTSANQAARLRIPTTRLDAGYTGRMAINPFINKSKGTIRVVITPLNNYNQSPYLTSRILFDDSNGDFHAEWDGSNNWTFGDGTNTATSSNDTFSAGDTIILHFVWGPNGLAIYKNGSSIGSDGTYTIPSFGDYIYIGCNNAATNQISAILKDFCIYGEEFTATEVLADYNQVAPLVSSGYGLQGVPWMWTIDGDQVIDNTTGTATVIAAATTLNCAVIGGVQGSLPAEIEMATNVSAPGGGLHVSRTNFPRYMYSTDIFFHGTPTTNATEIEFTQARYYMDLYNSNKEFIILTRAYWTAAAKNIYSTIQDGSEVVSQSEVLSYTGAGASNYRLYRSPSVSFPKNNVFNTSQAYFFQRSLFTFNITFTASTTPTADWIMIMPRPYVFIPGNGNADLFRDNSFKFPASSGVIGDKITLIPNETNYLISVYGDESTDAATATYNTIVDFYVIPRYAIL